MRDEKQYLSWCLRQRKGIRIVKPSDNLTKAYRQKSRNALKSMEVNAQAGLVDWAVSASYYAKYFEVYALLCKIGAKCEIHDCTIALFEYLFSDALDKETVKDLRSSKDDRVEVQYYTQEVSVDIEQVMKNTKKFILEIEKIIDGLSSSRIAELQNALKSLTAK